MILAIFQNERVYEGNDNFINAVYPLPCLSPVAMGRLDDEALEFLGNPHPNSQLLFREDSFDPTSRLRRGRFYTADNPDTKHWQALRVNHYPYANPVAGIVPDYPMKAYQSLTLRPPPRRAVILLGTGNSCTPWRIVGAEQLFNGESLCTLKAVGTLGVLPEIAEDSLPREFRDQIVESIGKVADAANKYLAVPTIDVCRESARVLLAAWLSASGENVEGDLGTLVKTIPSERVGIAFASNIINRLHSRGKSSEQERQAQKGNAIRMICVEDADLSVFLIGFLIREFNWAVSSA